MEHTPGPWIVKPSPGNISADFTIYEKSDCAGPTYSPIADCYENKSNAILIAAAPDLLAALQSLLELADRQIEEDCPQIDKARDAIAKATGQ